MLIFANLLLDMGNPEDHTHHQRPESTDTLYPTSESASAFTSRPEVSDTLYPTIDSIR